MLNHAHSKVHNPFKKNLILFTCIFNVDAIAVLPFWDILNLIAVWTYWGDLQYMYIYISI